MRDLRVRLGVILALALMPLLIFSMWRSYSDYNRDQALLRSNTDLTARLALSEIVGSFDTTQSILRVAATLLEGDDCKSDLGNLVEEYPRFHNIIQATDTGQILCSAKQVRSNDSQASKLLADISKSQPYTTKIFTLPNPNGEPATVIATALGQFADGRLTKVLVAVEDASTLVELLQKSRISESNKLAVFDDSGKLLGGVWKKGDLQHIAQRLPSNLLKGRMSISDLDGQPILILPTPADGIYLGVASQKKDLMSWNKFLPMSFALIPLIAWLFGFVAIWLSADQLVLSHLRRMRGATLAFAKGDRSIRIGEMKNSPPSIDALGENFDMMADRIVEREATISDSLDEKETLLREIHHRVKNNLQIIISLLNMQERKLTDNQGLAAIVETRSRINAIALVHKGLYESTDLRYVDMRTFLARLLPELALALGFKERGITVSNAAECDPMEADTATPVALFIVEALTNAVKHGVSQGGHIVIAVLQEGETVRVSVSDDGRSGNGQSGASLSTSSNGTGTKLMKGFARQLGGKLDIKNSKDGYAVSLQFVPRDLKVI